VPLKIKSLTHAGMGCPAGTVYGSVAEGNAALKLAMANMLATKSPSTSIRDSRLNCQLMLDLDIPTGWSLSFNRFSTRNYDVSLDRRTTAQLRASQFTSASSDTLTAKATGALSGQYDFLSNTIAPRVWTICGSSRSLSLRVDVTLAGGYGQLRGDSVDGDPTWIFDLVWKKCR
jgi:hypothetical protein